MLDLRDAELRLGRALVHGVGREEGAEAGLGPLPEIRPLLLRRLLGLGERLAPLTARFLLGAQSDGDAKPGMTSLVIAGTEGMVVSYARCCHPIPGDDVMGYLSSGRGIVIHRNNCGNLSNFRKQPEKWIAVSWEKNIDLEFTSQIHNRKAGTGIIIIRRKARLAGKLGKLLLRLSR